MTDDHVTSSEVEIAASPDAVWAAITTSAGSAAWSFRSDVEPREGGVVQLHRAPFGPDATATVTAWEPPRRFAYADPVFATEFVVTARGQGSCVVRVVSSLRADGEGWDDVAEEAGTGWRMTLLTLRAYVTHFAGRSGSRLDFTMPVNAQLAARAEVGALVARELGLNGLAAGAPFRPPASAPNISGTIEHLGPYFTLLRVARPCPGLFAISAFPMDAVTLSVNVMGRLYGPDAEAIAAREHPRWQEWLARLVAGAEH
jgi:uncharacterized protein YndB with AHSA1/START domain